jgi:transposase InsO family protein
VESLKMAVKNNAVIQKLTHHPNLGVQYCCSGYVYLLEMKGIKISMTENGDPLENAIAERMNGILKDEFPEEVDASFGQAGCGESCQHLQLSSPSWRHRYAYTGQKNR